MTLDEFRHEMAGYRQAVDREAQALKDPYHAHDLLRALYQKFDTGERAMADHVLAEWALSEDANLRFDGLSLIDDFKIITALPALKKLAKRLASSSAVSAPYELRKVNCIITDLARGVTSNAGP
jgi:hypothetical protein